jgi:carbon storage regulator
MLILGRREGESILIEGGIRIVVVACERGGVRIGIEAPPDVKILRGEIADKVMLENQRATAVSASSPLLAALLAPQAPAALSPASHAHAAATDVLHVATTDA